MDLPTTIESTTPLTSQNSPSCTLPQPQPNNPYARMSSRRAIACVTCAKAKTKCDKALPACSRCIAKGIKCEPRSTRRTSENSYRTTFKRPFVSPKGHHSSSTMSSPSRHTSPRSIPSSSRDRAMRAAFHMDFRTAVKTDQQTSSIISGYPILTPLPTYASQIVDECYSYSSSPDQNFHGFGQVLETESFSNPGRLSPQTPEPAIYHEPLFMGENMDHYITSQPWSDHTMVPVGLDFEPDFAAMLPTDVWSASGPETMVPMAHMSWLSPALSLSSQETSAELGSHVPVMPSLNTGEYVENLNSSGTSHDDWSVYQPTVTHMNMVNMVTSAPFMHDMKSIPSHSPIWEDVFISGSSPY